MKLKSDPRPVLMRLSILPLLLLAVAGCAGTPPIVAVPSACSSLVPAGLRADVAGVEPYGSSPTVGDLVAFGDGQTAALDTANLAKRSSIEIVEACERRDQETVARLTARSVWQRVTPWRE